MKPLLSLGALFVLAAVSLAPANAAPKTSGTMVDGVRRADVRDMGPADAHMPVSFSVALRYRHDADIDRLIEAQGDATSPLFGHFLTSKQFNDYFAPTQRDYARVLSALSRAGFTVTPTANRTLVRATGSAQAAERYFGTQIRRVSQSGYGIRYANTGAAKVPHEIADVTLAVVGLNNIHSMTTDHFFASDPDIGSDKLKKGAPFKGPNGGYGPWAIAMAYNYPVQHKFDGTGHAAAVAIDYDSNDDDLNTFAAYFLVKRTGKMFHVPVDGGQAYNPTGSEESTLDVETIATLAPGADVYVYNFGAAFTYQEISDAYNQAVSDNFVDEVSSSFGGCEDDAPQSFTDTVNSITRQGAVLGIGFNASTGDFGRGGKCSDGTGQDTPAVLRYFLSVGGSDPTINTDGTLASEHEASGSGGGPSDIFPIPKYQVGLPGVYSTTTRNIPDVSGPYYPDAFFINGRWGTIGGTSWASPATAAFLIESNQQNGKRLGYPNKRIYSSFGRKGYQIFNDVTTGNNGIACTSGYDDCSGIGTLKAFNLAKKL